MTNWNEQLPIARPVLNLFYVLDTSGSMNGQPITMLNRAMRSTLGAVARVAEGNRNAKIKVSVLEFNSSCRWLNPDGPEDLDSFIYENLTAVGGTNMGLALRELDSKLSKHGFIDGISGNLMPVIIFMTDGYPTDDYKRALEKIRQNRWFSEAARIGFAIGRKPDKKMIAHLTGTSEAVIRTEDLGAFAALLEWVSITSSLLQSTMGSGVDERDRGSLGSRSNSRMAVRQAKQQAGYSVDDFKSDVVYEERPVEGGSWGPETIYVDPRDYVRPDNGF